jgi:hypothetical protein
MQILFGLSISLGLSQSLEDLVLKKDIRNKDKHKFSSSWEGPSIVVDIAALGAYVAEVDDGVLPNT